MNDLISYCRGKDLSPEVFAVINTLLTLGDGIPTRFLDSDNINDAINENYVMIVDDRAFLTQKAVLFISTFDQIQRSL